MISLDEDSLSFKNKNWKDQKTKIKKKNSGKKATKRGTSKGQVPYNNLCKHLKSWIWGSHSISWLYWGSWEQNASEEVLWYHWIRDHVQRPCFRPLLQGLCCSAVHQAPLEIGEGSICFDQKPRWIPEILSTEQRQAIEQRRSAQKA